jgi:hypothetical protein
MKYSDSSYCGGRGEEKLTEMFICVLINPDLCYGCESCREKDLTECALKAVEGFSLTVEGKTYRNQHRIYVGFFSLLSIHNLMSSSSLKRVCLQEASLPFTNYLQLKRTK